MPSSGLNFDAIARLEARLDRIEALLSRSLAQPAGAQAADLQRIEAKLDHVLNGPPKAVISIREAMPLTGCRSVNSQLRWFKRYGVRPYERGKYRRLDITNAVAQVGLFAPASSKYER